MAHDFAARRLEPADLDIEILISGADAGIDFISRLQRVLGSEFTPSIMGEVEEGGAE
ncbi:hypothetical protein [Ensifer sp. LCM 4579]|uniref:hypothetical protein n=1 Tax=Ensifer sp. LCM 4579 TaxID=1848292 RepID=UPI001FCCC1CD|nr:hypothetical protein [Ensifer sp. LCM 4579]